MDQNKFIATLIYAYSFFILAFYLILPLLFAVLNYHPGDIYYYSPPGELFFALTSIIVIWCFLPALRIGYQKLYFFSHKYNKQLFENASRTASHKNTTNEMPSNNSAIGNISSPFCFMSYESEDRGKAHILANNLMENGFSVWWDRHIPLGENYDQVIEKHLEESNCVIVLWSSSSVKSNWVKAEATVGVERNNLIPALIDDVKIPLEFRRLQTANLIGWNGESQHEGFDSILKSVNKYMKEPQT